MMFDFLFRSNISPVFYIEVLADLEKYGKNADECSKIVRNLSKKTPTGNGTPNIQHNLLCIGDLLGQPVSMQYTPVAWEIEKKEVDGVVYEFRDIPTEVKMFDQWGKGIFSEQERFFAKQYRDDLKQLELNSPIFRIDPEQHFVTLNEIREFTEAVFIKQNNRLGMIKAALKFFNISPYHREQIMQRWKKEGAPCLENFAPYASYVMSVHFFFQLAVRSHLESAVKKSNFIDLTYLFYLPFSHVFISSDKFHERIVPHFLKFPHQHFISAKEMKNALTQVVHCHENHPDKHTKSLSSLEEEIIERNHNMKQIYDRICPGWKHYMPLPLTPEILQQIAPENERILHAIKKLEAGECDIPRQQEENSTRIVRKMVHESWYSKN